MGFFLQGAESAIYSMNNPNISISLWNFFYCIIFTEFKIINLFKIQSLIDKKIININEEINTKTLIKKNIITKELIEFNHPARKRLIFDELLAYQLCLRRIKLKSANNKAKNIATKRYRKLTRYQ